MIGVDTTVSHEAVLQLIDADGTVEHEFTLPIGTRLVLTATEDSVPPEAPAATDAGT